MNQFYKKQILIVLFSAMAFCLFGCGDDAFVSMTGAEASPQPAEVSQTKEPEKETARPEEETENGSVFVHVCGCVNAAGVYELPADARIYEAVEMAGGFTGDAAADSLNLAQTLSVSL